MANRTVPRTALKSTNDLITGALWNAGPKALGDFALNPPIFRARSTSTSSPIQGNWVVIPFDISDVDTEGGHSTTVQNYLYTCQVTGWYWVEAYTAYGAGGTPNPSRFEIAVAKNNVFVPGSATFTAYQNDLQSIMTATLVGLGVGDQVTIQTRQNTSSTLSWFEGADLANCVNMFWVSR